MVRGKRVQKSKGRGKAKKKDTPPSSPAASSEDEDDQPAPQPVQPADDPADPADPDDPAEEEPEEEKGKKARKKKSCRLKDEQQEGEVLEWVEENQLLWNTKHKEFKLKQKKDRLWAEKAEELGYDGKLLYYN